MGRAVLQLTLLWVLLTLAASRPLKSKDNIRSFHINSTVSSRYATTVITSRVTNSRDESKEIKFHVQIPKNAFISKFRMFIDDDVYDGVVKTKEQAQQQYSQAVSRGQSAGIVSSVGRNLEKFKTSVTVAAHKKVTFELTYEELLKRTHGKYELLIHARPMQPVKDFKVDVHIYEKAGISYIDVKGGLSTKALANAITRTHADKQAWVHFYPTVEEQKSCDSCGEQGMNGDLVVVYDVNRDQGLGDIKTSDGFFVHHFAPSNLPPLPKNIVFLIDTSISMEGTKIRQTKTALLHVLNDLAEDDFFGLITFDDKVSHWQQELVQATDLNLEKAKHFVRRLYANRATDINSAVLEGARMLNAHPREGSASILILLTDGDPTSGETNPEIIQSNVKRAIAGKFPLYCLGFGFLVEFEFLEKMSLENNGFARRIYTDSDADLQLEGFYDEVSAPLLTDVMMIYVGGNNLTQTNFSQYYNGSEIVVAGQITDNDLESFNPQVVAISSKSKVTFSNTNSPVEPSTGSVAEGLLQRVWAYLTVKQLLQKELLSSGPDREKIKKDALELSLIYGFVTPLTSMVVTKPQEQHTEVLHKPNEGKLLSYDSQNIGRWSHDTASSSTRTGKWAVPPLDDTGNWVIPPPYNTGAWTRIVPTRPPPFDPGAWTWIVATRPPPSDTGAWTWIVATRPPPSDTGTRIVPTRPPSFDTPQPAHVSTVAPDVIFWECVLSKTQEQATGQQQAGPVFHRLLLKNENLSPPLCFDISGSTILKLFHHPSRDLYINGELDSERNGGFAKITIHTSNKQHVEIDTEGITVHEGNVESWHSGLKVVKFKRGNATCGVNGINVAVEDIRLVIVVHEKKHYKFLWPVLERPSARNTEGILALKAPEYEEVPQSQDKKLKINNREIDATRSTAQDYSVFPQVEKNCWLISPDDALQRPLQDFITANI